MMDMKTPFFLIKENLLSENIKGFRNALDQIWPNSIIAYSVKTNSLPWVLSWMNGHEVYAEVVSDEEYQLAQMAGFSPERIVFNGPIKSDKYLKYALENGSIVNLDSKHELDCIVNDRPPRKGHIGIRINVDPAIFKAEDVGYQEDGFRFGFSEENGDFKNALDAVRNVYSSISVGLHMHVNSITRSVDVYRSIARFGASLIRRYGINPAFIDIGGGFFGGVPGKATPREYIAAIREELDKVVNCHITRLIIEPGSAAIGSAMELHTSVIDVKDTAHARIVTTDGSRIHIDPLWLKKRYIYETDSKKNTFPRQVVCGYTCMDHDRIMIAEDAPELSVGNRIMYKRVGNYTATFGGPFIKPFPPVYVQDAAGIRLVREQMTIEEYYRMENARS